MTKFDQTLTGRPTALWMGRLLLGCACIGALGCGSSPSVPVRGTVSYQGEPIQEGQIVFFPLEGEQSPSTGGVVRAGRYDIPKSDGPYAGLRYRVEITALGAAKSYAPNATGDGPIFEVREQVIPPQYNQQTTLSVTISADTQEYNFDLK